MPYMDNPRFSPQKENMYSIDQPGIGGLNMSESEFHIGMQQSPFMVNMYYDHGLKKRWGTEVKGRYFDPLIPTSVKVIHASIYFKGVFFAHADTDMHYGFSSIIPTDTSIIKSGLPNQAGIFITYGDQLFYFDGTNGWIIDPTATPPTMTSYDYYVPTVLINASPDGTYADPMDAYNVLTPHAKTLYHGDGSSTVYKLYGDITVTSIDSVVVGSTEYEQIAPGLTPGHNQYSWDIANNQVKLNPAPAVGTNNVTIRVSLGTVFSTERTEIFASKVWAAYGSGHGSRLFVGNGNKIWYSEVLNPFYFTDNNYIYLDDSPGGITGMGIQYDRLIVFKENMTYALESFVQTETVVVEDVGLEAFRIYTVNAEIGCDAPKSIQLIDNLLTWFHSKRGVCTLISAAIKDERNIRVISNKINVSNESGIDGILSYGTGEGVCSIDYDGKYILDFPDGNCFVWDYKISTYKDPTWFFWYGIYAVSFCIDDGLYFTCSYKDDDVDRRNHIMKFNDSLEDFNIAASGYKAIEGIYQTPALQFGSTAYLKTVHDVFVQVKGQNATEMEMYYYTDVDHAPRQDESIRLGGHIWNQFNWGTFQWRVFKWATTLRRRCNLRKIQMASFLIRNNTQGQDMHVTNITAQYKIVREIK